MGEDTACRVTVEQTFGKAPLSPVQHNAHDAHEVCFDEESEFAIPSSMSATTVAQHEMLSEERIAESRMFEDRSRERND